MTMNSKFAGTCAACNCKFPAGEQIEWSRGAGARHATPAQCALALNQKQAAKTAPTVKLNLAPIANFLKAAQARGLQRPKLRVLTPDGKTEMRISITTKGMMPGSIAVLIAGDFIGCVHPDGTMTSKLAADVKLQEHILYIARNPAMAAKEYAALMGLCSFCGKQLTDAGSVEVGYGPICAEKYGLPHRPQGTPSLQAVQNGLRALGIPVQPFNNRHED